MAPPGRGRSLTKLCERLAERLGREGYDHPLAAAVALAVRGVRGVDRASFARDLHLQVDELEAMEEGRVALGDLPPGLLERARDVEGLDVEWLRRRVAGEEE